jgi:hypothetical protein
VTIYHECLSLFLATKRPHPKPPTSSHARTDMVSLPVRTPIYLPSIKSSNSSERNQLNPHDSSARHSVANDHDNDGNNDDDDDIIKFDEESIKYDESSTTTSQRDAVTLSLTIG